MSREKEYVLEKDLEPWRQEALETLREEGEVFVLVEAKGVQFKALEDLKGETLFNNVFLGVQAISSEEEKLKEMVEPNVRAFNNGGYKFFTANLGMIASPTLEQIKDPNYDPAMEADSGILKLEDIKKEVSYKLEHGIDKSIPKEEKKGGKVSKIPKKKKENEGATR